MNKDARKLVILFTGSKLRCSTLLLYLIIKKRLRTDTSRVIIDAARPHLTKHLATRFEQKIGQNVNLLGEVVLGNEEADKRYYSYLEALKEPDINYIKEQSISYEYHRYGSGQDQEPAIE